MEQEQSKWLKIEPAQSDSTEKKCAPSRLNPHLRMKHFGLGGFWQMTFRIVLIQSKLFAKNWKNPTQFRRSCEHWDWPDSLQIVCNNAI